MPSFNHNTRQWDVLIGVLFPLTFIALVLRFVARWKKQVRLSWDDVLAVLSFVFWTGYVAVFIWAVHNTNGLDPTGLPLENIVIYLKSLYIGPILTACIITAAKFSILTLYTRVFNANDTFRLSVRIVGALCFAWAIAAVLVVILQCRPINAAWNPLIEDKWCINVSAFLTGIEIPNAILDFVIAGIAIHVIRGLQLNIVQKIGISFIFLMGACVGIIGFARVGITFNPAEFDVYDTAVWVPIQNAFAVFCCCFPAYRPLFSAKYPRLFTWSYEYLSSMRTGHSSERHKTSSNRTWPTHTEPSSVGSGNFIKIVDDESFADSKGEYPMGRISVQNELNLDRQPHDPSTGQ